MEIDRFKNWFTTRRIYLLSVALFVLWMIFFDGDNMLKQQQLYAEGKRLEAERLELKSEIKENLLQKEKLEQPGELEKYAREHYYFHKEDEDIFAIEYIDSIPTEARLNSR